MSARFITIAAVVAELNRIGDRADLVGFLAPLRLPSNLDDDEHAALTAALLSSMSRCMMKSSGPSR
jgi:hypothetical protein